MKVAITGNIASGKSSVAHYIRSQGFEVFDADLIVHQMYTEDTWIKKISTHFGQNILDQNQQIDRKKLGQIVFADPEQLYKLNQLTQNDIRERLENTISLSEEKQGIAFLEATLILERQWQDFFDHIIVVSAPNPLRLERLIHKGFSKLEAQQRIDIQESHFPQSEKIKFAHTHLENHQNPSDFLLKLKEDLDKLLRPFLYKITQPKDHP